MSKGVRDGPRAKPLAVEELATVIDFAIATRERITSEDLGYLTQGHWERMVRKAIEASQRDVHPSTYRS